MLDARLSQLIGLIYDGVHDPLAWDRAVHGMLERTGSRFSFVSVVDRRREAFSSGRFYGADDARFLDGVRDYRQELWRSDPTLAYGLTHPNAGVVSLRTVVPREDYERQLYPRWLASEMGGGDCVVRYTPPLDDLIFGISIHPPAWRGVHDPDELAIFEMLFPHFKRAVRLTARPLRLDGEEALLLLDRCGEVQACSPGAQRLLADADGISLRERRLSAGTRRDTQRLGRTIADALTALTEGGHGGAVKLPRPSGKRDWLVTVSPLPRPPPPFEAFSPAALVRIVDPDAAPADASARWSALFGFTPAECRLATALLAGEGGLRNVADELGVAYATARVHLAHLLDKTGTHSQSQLARLLTRLEG